MVFLHTMKVTLINLTRSQWFSFYLAVILFALNTHYLEVEKLTEIFKKNGYPSGIIELSIRIFLNRLYVPKQIYSTAPKKELLIILLFLGTMSSNLKWKLHTSIRNSLPQCNIKVILRSTNHLSSLFCFKDVIPKELRPQLVYKFWCSSCNATYYGKIERHLNVRSGEHIGLASFTENRVACKPSTISDHLLLHEHNNSSFNDFLILCCENNAFKLSSPELNRNVSSIPLLLFNNYCIITNGM